MKTKQRVNTCSCDGGYHGVHRAGCVLNKSVNSELLDACKALLDMITDNRLHGEEVYQATQAIAKARGEV